MSPHDEEALRKLLRQVARKKGFGPLSPQQAQAEYDAASPEPLSKERIDRIVNSVVVGHRELPVAHRPDHPSADDLAAYRSGLFDERKSHEIDAHLSTCRQCLEAFVSAMGGARRDFDTSPITERATSGVLWIGNVPYLLVRVDVNEWDVRGLSAIDAVQIRNRDAVKTRVITWGVCLRGMTERVTDSGTIRLAARTTARASTPRLVPSTDENAEVLYEWRGDGYTFRLLERDDEVHIQWY